MTSKQTKRGLRCREGKTPSMSRPKTKPTPRGEVTRPATAQPQEPAKTAELDATSQVADHTAQLFELQTRIATLTNVLIERMAGGDTYQVIDPRTVASTLMHVAARAVNDPAPLFLQQAAFWTSMIELSQLTARRMFLAEPVEPLITPATDDRRFKSSIWDDNPVYSFVKQAYLLTGHHMQSAIGGISDIDAHTMRKAQFYLRQYIDALAPTNFAAINPAVLEATRKSGGQNLLIGLNRLLEDLERGGGHFLPRMTDLAAFKIGETIAVTPGKVVFQNDLIQLIQYEPASETVHQRPLLIVPPWINKYYVLDLRPANSFIRWAVALGHTVFVISWVNPDRALAETTFADYMLKGPLAALDAIAMATDETRVNLIGYCIGGTLSACTLAYMAARNDDRIVSATFLTTMLDFSDVGEVSVFIDEEQLELLDEHMQREGFLEGRHMAEAFHYLRDKELIWSSSINNYLLGREPPAFDILYWNSDWTRLPAAMHSFYLRNMYHRNLLRQPDGIVLNGVPIDLSKVKVPAYFLSAHEDHIAPWRSTFAGARLFAGPTRFVLGRAGHIAAVVNPPDAIKYGYWTGDFVDDDPDTWLSAAREHSGSWWSDWARWIAEHTGSRVLCRRPGDGRLVAIEDAPGAYVRVRVDGHVVQ